MSRNDVELVYELSPMQQAMLFSSLYAPGSGVYVVQLTFRLSGRLDVPALERAWRQVVERHGALRTGFYWEDLEKPIQVVYRKADLEIRRESWRELTPEDQSARLREFLDEDREAGFDLGDPPLLRVALFDLGPADWQLVWTVHHLVIDGWSLGVLLKDLFTAYAAAVGGQTAPLGRARSYRDYIGWLQRQDSAEAEAFWRQSLAGLDEPALLAGGDGRPVPQSGFRGAVRRQVRLSAETTAALREMARRHRMTMNTLLQGAWSLVLAQATGGRDVVFGSTVAGRPPDLPGADSIVGLFINTLPVRVEVDPEERLMPWLAALQDRQVEARRFEHAPLHEVQGWSGLPAGRAVFDHILVFENYAVEGNLLGLVPDLSISGMAVNELTNYPLHVLAFPDAEMLLEIVHDSERFEPGAGLRFLEHLVGLLEAFTGDPDARLGDLPWLLDSERQQVVREWNDTWSGYPRQASLPELFAERVAAAPQVPAIVDGNGEVWSYERLDRESGRLASVLAGSGVGPGDRVGVAMERSADLLMALLAIVKAGAGYVPLDPGYPDERLAFMLEDTGAAVVLVHGRTRERLAALVPEGLICLDRDRETLEAAHTAPLPERIPAEALAYVIYTSGSTGRPKGVTVPHQAIVRLVRETDYVQLRSDDRVAHLSNTSFDAATFEIWGALLNGAAVVVIPREVALVPADLAALLRRERVTTLFLTTALFNQVIREIPDAFAPLRHVLFGGEAVDPSVAARALEAGGPERLLHVYGPTESTTYATWHPIHEVPPRATTIPIGRPLANTTFYVVDRWRQPVPPGVAGELLVGGEGLAWGYWNRPDLTAERFVPHPWADGERLYRTGDLVRHRTDGPVEFLGRIDNQVKIRGFRIEPGEVETVLLQHPEVQEAIVLAREEAREEAPGDRRLVAWLVLDPKSKIQNPKSDLGAWLRERLPDYMVPSAFVRMEALPLTPNGKVDRKALPAPESGAAEMEGFAAPGDPIEELIASLWAEVLGLERVGVHDEFFELGGHSLLATQVMSRIRSVLGVELPLRRLFETPTVAGLALAAREELQVEGAQAPPLVAVPRGGDLPLSFAQQRLWFIDQLEPGNPGYNIPAAVRLTGELSIPRLAGVFAEVVRRHEVLRTTFASHEGRPVQIIAPKLRPELPVVDLSGLTREEREERARRLAIEESLWPFDLRQGPLLRLTVLRFGEREHLLLLTLHHIISDGWSMGVLVREVLALYRGLTLPELPIQYADFAVWQRQWLAGEVLERQLAFWREQLEGTSGVLELPTDRPRPAVLSLRGAEHRVALDLDLSRRIVETGRREGVTPFMILAAGLFALLARLSGQKDLNLGSPIANRNRIETEGLIGFFVNTLVLRADVGQAETFLDLLLQVREASLGAYAHQDLPFEKLVDELQLERDLSRSPLVQVALAVNNAAVPEVDLEGLRLTSEDPLAQVAKFDLAFIFAETAEGRFAGSLQFATDLYDAATAVRLTRQLEAFLDELIERAEEPLIDLSPLTAEEKHQVLFEWNDTGAGAPRPLLMHQLFEQRVDGRPEATAAVWEDVSWSYAGLEARANRLAHLLGGFGVGVGTPVGVWMERSNHMLEAVLGILKAGGTYVPLDAAWPADRVEAILAGTGAPVIVVSRATLPAVERMRWRLPRLADVVCPDLESAEPEPEAFDTDSVSSLFDYVAERATDRVTAGGFVSSFTGLPFRAEEVDEYRDRVLSLAAPWLRPGARVLEVGCGSGEILWEMARRVETCVGLDPSALTQQRNREHARAEGLDRVDLRVGFAHEIGALFPEGSFDLVVMASTVQFFPGPRYLERVVADALRLLAPDGALLVADVMDARREAELHTRLAESGASGATTAGQELWVDEDLFRDLGEALPGAGEVEVLHRTQGFANELGFRYDVLLRKAESAARGRKPRRKRLWTGWHAAQRPAARPAAVGTPIDVAYVIHTSGSTGAPKGIAVQHAPVVNLIDWINPAFGVGPDDRLLFVTSLCFDLSVYDIFGTLAAGGTVHVASEAALREPERLVGLLRDGSITIWDSAPAALQQLAPLFPAPGAAQASVLRLVMLSGDWIPVRLPDQVRAAFPRARVMSLGGATEATVWSNWFPVREVDPRWPSIPYGRPIANARYHVLDEGMLPCPIGVPGDLYIGGRCLCVGYADQPELTANQFVPDPFAPEGETGARLYRTGDRARFFEDGNIEFLGRVDQQVKVRGYRIELGEIEVALVRHHAVRQAVVTVREDRPGDRMLVAYVVPVEGEAAPEIQELRAWLGEKLPAYMVPPAYVVMEALPVTANGKLDRKALPAPELGGADEGAYEPPSDPVEETLAELWAEVLALDRVSVRDNFFLLGGHSLLATQLISRIRGALGVELVLRELFEAPTVAELARTVRAARRRASAPAAPVALIPVPRTGDLPLSFAQQRLWLIDQLEPGNPAYNVPSVVRLTGEIATDLLARIFAEVVRRHESLRTTFASHGVGPVQVIGPPQTPELPVFDLSHLPEGEREERARQLAAEEARRPFDLAAGPLLRLTLVRLGEGDHLLLTTLHHIVADAWSLGVLLREIAVLYEAFAGSPVGEPPPLPELPVQYADFAVWQRSWLQGEELERQLAFWMRELSGATTVLELPTDRPRPPVQTYRGASRRFQLTPALSQAVRDLCVREGATPFMVLLTAWAALLARHAGQEDLLVGAPVAGRNRREVEDLIGFFINTVVLWADLSGAPPFTAALERVRRTALDAFAHQDFPFERLVEELAPERDPSRSPLFQTLFVLQNAPLEVLAVPGLALTPVAQETGLSKFDLSLSLWEGEDGFVGALEHNTDLFDGATAERLLARFTALLEGAAADPGRALPDLPLLLPAELDQVLRKHNDTATAYPREASLPELFEAVARELPDAPAIVGGNEEWTYRRLDAASNRLARRLRGLGVGPETPVGLSMERSPELILGILAILKAGGVYIPLDAGYPDERLAFLLEDTGARVVLVDGTTLERLESFAGARLVPVAGEGQEAEDARPLGVRVPSESLACVLYTSGSTGQPKGVAIPHRAIVRLVRETDFVRLGPGDRTGQVASVSFDATTYEVWGALLNGAAVAVIPREVVLSPAGFAARLRELRVTSMFLTSALFTRMSQEAPEAFEGMSELLVGGEAVDPAAARAVLAGRPPRRLLNGYGPTESTTFAAWHLIGEVAPEATSVPIGRPLANTTLYILDRWQSPVPPGSAGELYIGGDGLARGYLNRPQLTAERFVPHPWVEGSRLYRTGDLVRQRPDGAIEYLGRLDNQVKIRGFRIEPGEIEAVLAGHPEVRECAVLARQDMPGEIRLVAYVVGGAGVEELRAWLQGRLPDYMLPTAFVTLEALPLTANGKLDRRALPAPERARAEEDYVPPAGALEELLAGVWAEVLALDRVGAHDDFFALGGHSLLATQMVSRVRGLLGLDLPLRMLFEAPTLTGFAAVIEAVRAARGLTAPVPTLGTEQIVPVPRTEDLPLSFAQQRLWLIDQLEPGNPAYNVPSAIRLTGEVEPDLLARLFAEVARRHESLRTTFEDRGGKPVQVIAPASEALPELPVLDLTHLPAGEREERARQAVIAEAQKPFDLRNGPLLRLALVRLGEWDHLLLVTLHHIVSDGWSMGVLLREIAALYPALSEGRPSPLPELPVQYADFAVWQRSWLQGEVLERQLGFWKRELAGAPAVLELPTDRPRPAAQTHHGASRPMTLTPALSQAVRDLCAAERATPFMVLLTAWAMLLGRHAGQEDLLVGAPVAGRNRREIEDLIGFFVNTLVLRADLSGAPSFLTALGRMRRMTLDAFAHQDLPFERLVEELAPERDPSRSPLFQALFVFQNAPVERLSTPGFTFAPVAEDTGLAKFDLSLILWEGAEGFAGALEHNTDLFDGGTAERLLARFSALLEGAAAEPGRALPDLPLLIPAELEQVLREHNATASAYPREAGLPELFEAIARERPDAPAIVGGGEEWTYRRLDEASNRLARRLRGIGVGIGGGAETPVGLSLERSPELILATLAILKAGGVYVPLDASYPDERLAFMLEDTGASVVLVDERTRERLSRLDGTARLVLVDGAEGEAVDARPLGVRVPAESLAYVIYTSGSTGRPKGVAVPHRAIVRLVRETNYVRLGPDDRTGHVANISFDAATYEIWGALLNGGAVAVIPREVVLSPQDFAARLRELRVSTMFLTSALFTKMAKEVPDAFAGMSELLVGGEAVDPAAARTVLAGRPPRRLLNGYGPTESTTFAAWHHIAEVAPDAASIPIGLPLANTTLYVLDRRQAPVPQGSAGELCIGGDGLARGYLNRPELTAERFVPHPWGEGGRLYRTGDLVRQRPDGAIEYLGRLDTQVKIRGFRIEPGEIEAVLAGHPEVRECAVLARRDSSEKTPGETRLVAYVVGGPRAEELRAWLQGKVPDYMLPSAFVTLDALPLTANGKLDRKALPAPERVRAEDGYAAPGDPLEELLAGVWAEVLGLDRVGVRDDFFALGGHSLLATQVVSRIRGVLGVDLPLRTLFESPTVAELSQAVRALQSGTQAPPIVPIEREGRDGFPLSFAQQRLWFLDQLEPGNPAYNIPLAVRLTGEADTGLLERIFAEIVGRHEALRTTFASQGGVPVQVIRPDGPESCPELPLLDLTHLPPAAREVRALELALNEARRPFDLQHGPVLRLGLVRLDERDHILLVTIHHIVSDGWSMGVLLREIAALYEALSQGTPAALPELPVQYADFSAWQREWLQGEVLETQLAYWKRELAGAPRLLELPTDRPRPATQTYGGASWPVVLPAALSEAVRELCRREGVTPFMALLAAWSAVLGRLAGQEDVLVGSPIAGRNRSEIEDLIGFFVNTLVLRNDLSGAPTFRELLGRVRRASLDAYTHQDLPFERIVEEVVPERDLSHTPLFQVLFVLQNAPWQELQVPGLSLAAVAQDSQMAKFDLTLTFREGADGFAGALEHSTDLFDGSTAERYLARFQALLAEAAVDPGRSIVDLPVLLAAERQQLLEWNNTGAAPLSGLCLHELVAAQVERTPDAVALVHGDERWTYAQLAARAGGLALRLRALGIGPEVRVAVCLERSPDLIASLLGVLAAGGAYVPVDPAYPVERRALMLEDSGAAVLVTRGPLAADLPDLGALGARVLDLDALDVEDIAPAAGLVPPDSGAAPDHLAYIIYTSGSTGRPKGVAIEHRSAVALAGWAREEFSAEELSGVLAATSVCFDLSVFEIFVPLAWGGKILLADNALALPTLPAASEVRLLNTVPSAATELHRGGSLPASVRTVCLAGEPLPAALAAKLYATGTVERVLNLYGPSEDTTYSTGALVPRGSERAPAIGRPLRGTRAHVVDRNGVQVPPGVAGELWLAGAGLARGYLGRPELTAERFAPDPFGEPGGRVYRTGDLTRLRSDGELDFLGRIDHQVKVRGFRIELGEIESVLRSHPSVRECVTLVREDTPSSRLVVAYVVGDPESPPDKGVLRSWLTSRLPDYMVPAAFVVLEALPLSPNGKVDRKALPAPDRAQRAGAREIIRPRTATEEALAEIWKELLGLEQVSVEDGFFELGGHSLLATQAIARVRQTFGIDLPLREVFQRPTVAGLAEIIDNLTAAPADDSELAALLDELDLLSDEDARSRLDDLLSRKGES